MERPEKLISAQRVVVTSFIVDLIDITFNLIVAFTTGSVVMLAETLQGLADLLAVGMLLIGIKRSSKRADKYHPLGYGREIYFWALLSGVLMFTLTATSSFYFGLQRFLHPQPIENIYLAYLALALAILTNGYATSLSIRRLVGNKGPSRILQSFLHSPLVESKTTFILDLMGTTAAVLGMVSLISLGLTGNNQYDGIGGMLIGTALAVLSIFLLISIKDLIIGNRASLLVEDRIKEVVLQIPRVEEVIDLKTLHIGSERLMVNLEVNLEDNLTTNQIERLTDRIKEKVQDELPSVKEIQVEIEAPNLQRSGFTRVSSR